MSTSAVVVPFAATAFAMLVRPIVPVAAHRTATRCVATVAALETRRVAAVLETAARAVATAFAMPVRPIVPVAARRTAIPCAVMVAAPEASRVLLARRIVQPIVATAFAIQEKIAPAAGPIATRPAAMVHVSAEKQPLHARAIVRIAETAFATRPKIAATARGIAGVRRVGSARTERASTGRAVETERAKAARQA